VLSTISHSRDLQAEVTTGQVRGTCPEWPEISGKKVYKNGVSFIKNSYSFAILKPQLIILRGVTKCPAAATGATPSSRLCDWELTREKSRNYQKTMIEGINIYYFDYQFPSCF